MPIPEFSIEIGLEIFTNLVRSAYQGISGYNKEHDFFKTATKKYTTKLVERYSMIKVLGMPDPRPLAELYVRANILKEKITAEQGITAKELEKYYEGGRLRAFGAASETVDGELMVNKLQRFIVLGKPGAGKTTYLRYLALMMLHTHSQIEKRRLPIFITLREWADDNTPLLSYIVKQFDICHFEAAESFVERVLVNGQCIVLFDGLDEVSQDADQTGIIRQIKDFCDKYDVNQYVISCRVAAYNQQFERFHDVEMADFNEEQIEKFIRNWFYGQSKTAQECWRKLLESPQLKEMATVPLLLTLLCIAYNRSKNFPPNRADLYEEAIDALLRDWDATRDIKRDEVYKQLSLTRKKSMFARIAWGTFSENMYFVPERILTRLIGKYIENLPGFKPEDIEPDSFAVLKSIEAQHGIFVERAKKVHSFAHLTFQEYFTAKHIVDTALEGSLETLVAEHLYDDKWVEVFTLTAEMLGGADRLLQFMQQKNRQLLLEEPAINDLLFEVQAAILPGECRYPVLLRGVFGIYLALDRALDRALDSAIDRTNAIHSDSAIDRAIDRAKAIDLVRANAINSESAIESAIDRAIDLANDLAEAIDLDLVRAIDLDIDFAFDRVIDSENPYVGPRYLTRAIAIAHSFDLAQALAHIQILDFDKIAACANMKKINRKNISAFQNYLKANVLIVKCLQSGSYVSNIVREQILHNLIRPV